MSVMSITQPSPAEPVTRPRQAASDLDAVRSTGWLDSASAAYETAKDEVPDVQDARLFEAYAPVYQTVAKAMGKSPVFGYFSAANTALHLLPFTGRDANDREALWADIETLRRQGRLPAGVPTDRAKFESDTLTRGGQRTVDQIKASQGSFTSRVAGGVVAGFNDPVQVGAALATGGVSRGMSVGASILTEGLLNAGAAAIEMPATIAARQRLGETTTANDIAAELGTAFVFGGAVDLGLRGAGAVLRAGREALAIPERANPIKVAKAFAAAVPEQMRTPEQQAALHVIEREAGLEATAPTGATRPEIDAHLARIDAAQRALVEEGERAGAQGFARATRVLDGEDAQAAFMAKVRAAESSGSDTAAAGTSSAYGRYQFTTGTWQAYYIRRFGRGGLTDAQIAAKRADGALQDQLMQDLTADNAARLREIGAPVTEANLYLVHLLGPKDAEKVLRAGPGTALEGLISARSIAANRSIMAGKTVDDIVAFAERRMKAEPGSGGGAVAAPEAMADAEPLVRPDVPGAAPDPAMQRIDALLPELRILVADPTVKLNAMDQLAQQLGVDHEDVRTALGRLVGLGELGQRKDNGAFTRSRPPRREESLIEWIKRGGGVYDGRAEVDTFGGGDFASMGLDDWYKQGPFRDKKPIINNSDWARQNRGADKLFRAAVVEGFFPEHQAKLDAAGPDQLDVNDFLKAVDEEMRGRPRYRVSSLAWERQTKLQPDAKWTPQPDEVPNSSDRTFEEAIAQFNDFDAEALWFHSTFLGTPLEKLDPWILDRVWYLKHEEGKWQLEPVLEQAINDYAAKNAAEALAATGDERYGAVSYDWPTYNDPGRYGEGDAAGGDRGGYAAAGGAEAAGGARGADPAGRGEGATAPIVTALPDAVAERFSDPAGPEAKAQAEAFTHDLKAADPNIAAKMRQEADIAAQQPLTGARKTGVAQDPTMPEGLFGGPAEPGLFGNVAYGTGAPEAETVAQVLARLDDDDAALKAMRDCL